MEEKLKRIDLEKVVEEFKSKYYLTPEHRYASFDYCYNYFLRTEGKDLTKDIEKSCLVLGFYLASWGMFRGSSFLLEKSVKHFEDTINYIASRSKSDWKIDVDNYDSDNNIATIIEIYSGIKSNLIIEENAHLTLITKILLGVFGFVPAFDNYFCDSFRNIAADEKYGFRVLNEDSLNFIKRFYEVNKDSIDKLSKQTYTIDFKNGGKTNINYTKAKIIDMYGFTIGLEKAKEKKKEKHNAKVSFLEG